MARRTWSGVAVAAVSLALATVAFASETITYTYDPNGRLVKVDHSGTANTGVATQYGYDKADNRTNVTVTGGPVTITGTAAGDTLNGTAGNDIVYGLGGNDWIHLHDGGSDVVYGGDGNDVIFYRGTLTPADTIDGGAGIDQIVFQGNYAAGLTLWTGIVAIESYAFLSASDNRFGGGGGGPFSYSIVTINQTVPAGSNFAFDGSGMGTTESLAVDGAAETDGALSLYGGWGADTLAGGANGDLIQGSVGADTLTGRGGNDTFKYRTAGDSTAAASDSITDFRSGDVISLSIIDANTGVAGDQAFTFIGTSAFGGVAGQLRVQQQTGNNWLVQGDVDGNGTADLSLALTSADAHSLVTGDFIL
jgi:YD repeat-containing protein